MIVVMRPTSCHCGGRQAWLKIRESGAEEMLGCVCHTELPAGTFVTGLTPEQRDMIRDVIVTETMMSSVSISATIVASVNGQAI